jgi:PII-like signaling protein
VDSAENIQRLLPVVEGMLDKGLIAISDVNVMRVRKAGRA